MRRRATRTVAAPPLAGRLDLVIAGPRQLRFPGLHRHGDDQARVAHARVGRDLLAMSPMRRLGEPVDVAQAVLYLASDAAAFVTGSNLIVDGGYTVW